MALFKEGEEERERERARERERERERETIILFIECEEHRFFTKKILIFQILIFF